MINVTKEWRGTMGLEDLRKRFINGKCYEPMNVNELLDYARQLYLKNELTITQYRKVIKELENKGAFFPIIETEVEIS